MKKISLPASALLALLQTGECKVRKPVAQSPPVEAWAPYACEWYTSTRQDKYGYGGAGPEVYGFIDPSEPWIGWQFPWGGPAEVVQIKGSQRRCEIMAVDVQAARKRYQWVITLKLI